MYRMQKLLLNHTLRGEAIWSTHTLWSEAWHAILSVHPDVWDPEYYIAALFKPSANICINLLTVGYGEKLVTSFYEYFNSISSTQD